MGITLQQVSYTYQANTPFEGRALFGVDLEIVEGSYTALIGHTGSGKSTILQLLNGLNVPTAGSVIIDEMVITPTSVNKDIKQVRKKVGPQNFGVSQEEAEATAREKLALVGIDEELYERSPFELSGGQMRRVAIAGILAMEPSVLVLDEPTAGLDPAGRKELMAIFKELHETGMTIVLVTHLMDDVANFADYVYVLEKGKVVRSGHPSAVFQEVDFMESIQLGVPKVTKFAANLERRGFVFEKLPIRIEELTEVLAHG